MKSNRTIQFLTFLFTTLVAVFITGCTQAAERSQGTKLTGIQILFNLDPRLLGPTYGGERWVSPATYGPIRYPANTYAVEARAQALDQDGQLVQANFAWKPEDPGMVTVLPDEGNQVTITILRAGESSLQVTSQGVSKTLHIKATVQNNVIEVELSQ